MWRQERKPTVFGSLPWGRRPLVNVLGEEVVHSASYLCVVTLVRLSQSLAKVKGVLLPVTFLSLLCGSCLCFFGRRLRINLLSDLHFFP